MARHQLCIIIIIIIIHCIAFQCIAPMDKTLSDLNYQ